MVEHVLDHVQLGLWSFEPWMRKIEDNPVKPSVLQFSVKLHCFYIDAMQNSCPQSFQLHYIWLCFAVLAPQSICKWEFPQEMQKKYISLPALCTRKQKPLHAFDLQAKHLTTSTKHMGPKPKPEWKKYQITRLGNYGNMTSFTRVTKKTVVVM